ncbi:MAG: GIY-YIG nuclease family protein [Selenomonadaceae bacterium]|nr:GIY-YIG nuclease family protein [Selenomonadaceae bacterium]
MESGIYMLTCRINGHRYIGQSKNIPRRFSEHKSRGGKAKARLPISRAINKYGWENFDKAILELCPVERLSEKEIYYIATLKPEYNISAGGESGMRGHKHSSGTKEKCRAAAIKEWQDKTEEEKQYIITNHLTNKYEKGHQTPEFVREKLRQANLGKKQSEASKAKKSQKQKISMLGNQNANKAVRCVETGEVFGSIKSAALHVGIGAPEITRVLRGYRNRKTSGGYHWEYHNSVETNRDECSDVGEKNELLLEVHGNFKG